LTILKVSAATIKIIPETPATPNPGMANTSTSIKITPIMNNRISQCAAKPSMYKGAKNNNAATTAAASGNPIPGL